MLTVALIQQWNARDVRYWSGIHHFSKAAVERAVGRVVDLSPSPIPLQPFRLMRGGLRALSGKRWSFDHDPLFARLYGRHFSRRIADIRPDLIYAPAGSACVPFLETDIPIVYYSDATWRAMEGYYASYSDVFARTARWGDELERRTLERCSVALFGSRWAAESAIRDYGVDSAKVFDVGIGANLANPPERSAVMPRRLGARLRLLFVGVRWVDKGGSIAYDTLLRLLERGIDAELTIVGCRPPREFSHPRMRVIPFLNKQIAREREAFERIWAEADLLLLPTRHECAGLVFCEAAAHALPVVTTDTGGVSSIVVDGRTGFTLPLDADGGAFAAQIEEIAGDLQAYSRLSEASRDEYEKRLNWDRWGDRVAAILEDRIPKIRGRTTRTGRG